MEKMVLTKEQIKKYIDCQSNKQWVDIVTKNYLEGNEQLYLKKLNVPNYYGYDYGIYDDSRIIDKVKYDEFMEYLNQ